MLVTPKQIYTNVAERNDVSFELISSIGNIIFQSLRTCLNDPSELAYEVPGLGTFGLRFNRFEESHNSAKIHHHDDSNNTDAQKLRLLKMGKIQTKIDSFRKHKSEVKTKRYGQDTTVASSES